MAVVSRGFTGRGRSDVALPPGQYLTEDFPVLSAGPTPRVDTDRWEFAIITETGQRHTWTWPQLLALPSESVTVDLHCVTKWSKLHTAGAASRSTRSSRTSRAPPTTRSSTPTAATPPTCRVADLLDGQAWIAYEYDGEPLHPEHGGPARLLVPHLYLWKSAKWVRAIELTHDDQPGFWETAGYHNYGDPWQEQRYWGD